MSSRIALFNPKSFVPDWPFFRKATFPADVPDAVRLGTSYGGWWVVPLESLRGGLAVCAGAGEDISFDVELARTFQARITIVDPTPRAIGHVEAVLDRIGTPATAEFIPGGQQPIAAYELTEVEFGQIQLLPAALWNQGGTVDLYPPINPAHVSHSASDWQRGGAKNEQPLRVESLQASVLLASLGASIALLKLDIEGAEIEVLEDVLSSGLRPQQILVEFDELAVMTPRHRRRAANAARGLRQAGYGLVHREEHNFTLLHSAALRASRTEAA